MTNTMTKLTIFLTAAAAAWAQGARQAPLEGQPGPVLGKPLAATEVRHVTQVLGDGTRVERSDSNRFYRDSQGRTRIETSDHVLLYDPVAGFIYNIDPQHKMYSRLPADHSVAIAVAGGRTSIHTTSDDLPRPPTHTDLGIPNNQTRPVHTETEDLPSQIVNGIAARGSRIASTVPAGAFGNDREVKIVNERWFSDDLQVLLKTSNSDPRFGLNTYELTNIVQGPPDATLFQIPADYILAGPTGGHVFKP